MTRDEFHQLQRQLIAKYNDTFDGQQPLLIINVGECTIAKGAHALLAQARAEVARRGADFRLASRSRDHERSSRDPRTPEWLDLCRRCVGDRPHADARPANGGDAH